MKMLGDGDGELMPIRFKDEWRGGDEVRLAGQCVFEHTPVLRVHPAALARVHAAGVGAGTYAGQGGGRQARRSWRVRPAAPPVQEVSAVASRADAS